MTSDISLKIFHVEVQYANGNAVLVEARDYSWEDAKIGLSQKYPDATEFFLIEVRVVQ
jgi:hypothetical protein